MKGDDTYDAEETERRRENRGCKMKRWFALASAMLAMPGTALSHTSHWSGSNMSVILRDGDRPIAISARETHLDSPREIECTSPKGCLISIQAQIITALDHTAHPCAIIDGAEAQPVCKSDKIADTTHVILQHGSLATGAHSIQTIVRTDAPGGRIQSWSINYTIYEK